MKSPPTTPSLSASPTHPLLVLFVHTLTVHQVVEVLLDRRGFPFQYGLFLQAVSRFPLSLENNAVISVVVGEVQQEEGKTPEGVYVSLLEPNSSSVSLAHRLKRLLPITCTPTTSRLTRVFSSLHQARRNLPCHQTHSVCPLARQSWWCPSVHG